MGLGKANYKRLGSDICTYEGQWYAGLMHGRGVLTKSGTVHHSGIWCMGIPLRSSKMQQLLETVAHLQNSTDAFACRSLMQTALGQDQSYEVVVEELEERIANPRKGSVSVFPKTSPAITDAMDMKERVSKLISNIAGACILVSRINLSTDAALLLSGMGTRNELFLTLRTLAAKVNNTCLRLPFLGPVKSGKSTSLNAFLRQKFNPSDALPLTVLPTIVQHKSIGLPELRIPHHHIYMRAAEALSAWYSNRHISRQWFDMQIRKLTPPEMKLMEVIILNEFSIPEHMTLAAGPQDPSWDRAYKTLADVNHLCRLYTKVQKIIMEKIAFPFQELLEFRNIFESNAETPERISRRMTELIHPWKKRSRRVRDRGSLNDDDFEVQVVFLQSLQEIMDDIPTPPKLTETFHWMTSSIHVTDESRQQWRENIIDLVAMVVPKVDDLLFNCLESGELHESLLTTLLDAGKAAVAEPWPRILFNIENFTHLKGDFIPSHIEVIDTPGLDELELLPELKDVIKHVIHASEGSICVCNAQMVGTRAFKDVVELANVAKEAGKPVFAWANRMDTIPEREQQAVKDEIAKALYHGQTPDEIAFDSSERVFGCSALYAYLSSAMDRQCATGDIQLIARRIAAKLQAQQKRAGEQESSMSDDSDHGGADDGQDWPLSAPLDLTPEEDEVMMCVRESKGKDAAKSPKKWRKFAKKPETLQKVVKSIRKTGGMDPFVEKLVGQMAPKALACQYYSSLMDLVVRADSPLKPLVKFSKSAVRQMEETQVQHKQRFKNWSKFDVDVIGYASQLLGKTDILEEQVEDIVTTAIKEVRVAFEHTDVLLAFEYGNKRGCDFVLPSDGKSQQLFFDNCMKLKEVLLAEQSKIVKDKIIPRMQEALDAFGREQAKEVEKLNPPEDAVMSVLEDLKIQQINYASIPISAADQNFTLRKRRAEQSWWMWLFKQPGVVVELLVSEDVVIQNVKHFINSGFDTMLEPYQSLLAEEAKQIANRFKRSVENLINEARKQFKMIKSMRTEPSSSLARRACAEISEILTESSDAAQALYDKVADDTRFKP